MSNNILEEGNNIAVSKGSIVDNKDLILAKTKLYVKLAIVVILVIVFTVGALRISACFRGEPVEIGSDTVINIANIEHQILSIGELATLQFNYRNVIHEQDSHTIGNWNIPFTQKSYIIIVAGTMKIGIDASEIQVRASEDARVVTIIVPRAKILSHQLHEDTIEVLEESSGLFNRVSIGDWSTLATVQKQEMEEEVSKLDVFSRAEDDAVRMLKSFIELAVPEDYTVNVTLR
jgi:hypothetical protein